MNLTFVSIIFKSVPLNTIYGNVTAKRPMMAGTCIRYTFEKRNFMIPGI